MRAQQTFGLHQDSIGVGNRRRDERSEGLQRVVRRDGNVPEDESGWGPLESSTTHCSHSTGLLHQGAGEDDVYIYIPFKIYMCLSMILIIVIIMYCRGNDVLTNISLGLNKAFMIVPEEEIQQFVQKNNFSFKNT